MRKPTPTTTTNTAVAYLRVSTSTQASEGHSLEAQRARVESYCALHGLTLVAVETDAGVSGTKAKRPGLDRALNRLRRGEATVLVCYSLSRLSRSVKHLCEIVDRYFRDGKRTLVSLTEAIDTSTAMGRGLVSLIGVINSIESELASERTCAVKEHLASKGRYLGGSDAPFGFVVDGKNLVPVEAEQNTIRAARAARERGLSLRAVSATLAEAGHVARTGKPFAPSQLANMLSRVPVDVAEAA
jgi:DNA invertase Pin-like site-specific DNA recombinase